METASRQVELDIGKGSYNGEISKFNKNVALREAYG